MMLQRGTLQTADDILNAIGGLDALMSEAIQTDEPKPLGWFSIRIGSKLARAKKLATTIAGVDATNRAHAAYIERSTAAV